MKEEILTAGFGGQGILFMGQVLASAAMLEGKEVTWLPSYGPEMRGGTARCMVVISDERIRSPLVASPTTALIFNLPSMDKFEESVVPGGLIVVNTDLVPRPASRQDIRAVGVPAETLAREVLDRRVVNMVMLGACLGAKPIVRPDSVLEALEDVVPVKAKRYLEPNKQAILKGVAAWEELRGAGK